MKFESCDQHDKRSEETTMQPSKRHDGKTITIRYHGAMGPTYTLTGKYVHQPRRGTFWFVTYGIAAREHVAAFERCDFTVVK